MIPVHFIDVCAHVYHQSIENTEVGGLHFILTQSPIQSLHIRVQNNKPK